MIKKVIIYLSILAFLSSVITPNFALAGVGEAQPISVGEALAWSAGFLIVIFGICYLIQLSKTVKIEKEVNLINQTAQKWFSSPAEVVIFRF
ncbi:MAG: hypothetical protein MUO88_03285 [Desulfobacterales bacterium]|nr:hypothetical protein [Desulfobacterales bacterium]